MKPSKILDPKRLARAGVLGNPVKHSLSPLIFTYLSKILGQPLKYQKYKISDDKLENYIRNSKEFIGFNVTIPHKECAAKLVDCPDEVVKAITSCNVVKYGVNKIFGFNTDIYGIEKTFKINKIVVKSKKINIYGAGGAAKSVAYVLAKKGALAISFVNRNKKKSASLIGLFSKMFPKTKFSNRELDEVDMVVNCTPLGMKGVGYKSLIGKIPRQGGIAFDLIYVPLETGFLKEAKRLGLRPVSGIDMFIWQAIRTWEIWFGPQEKREKLAKEIKALLQRELKN